MNYRLNTATDIFGYRLIMPSGEYILLYKTKYTNWQVPTHNGWQFARRENQFYTSSLDRLIADTEATALRVIEINDGGSITVWRA